MLLTIGGLLLQGNMYLLSLISTYFGCNNAWPFDYSLRTAISNKLVKREQASHCLLYIPNLCNWLAEDMKNKSDFVDIKANTTRIVLLLVKRRAFFDSSNDGSVLFFVYNQQSSIVGKTCPSLISTLLVLCHFRPFGINLL